MGSYQPHSCRLHYLTHMKEESMRMPENYELEQETAAVTSEISSEEAQKDSPVAEVHIKRSGTVL